MLTWLLFVRKLLVASEWRIVWALAGIVSPISLVFFGHSETYAIPYLLLLLWLIGLFFQLQRRNIVFLWSLLIGLIVWIKLHPYFWLACHRMDFGFFPNSYSKHCRKTAHSQRDYTFVLLPVFFALGMSLYVLFSKTMLMNGFLGTSIHWTDFFLPIFFSDPPLDRYNMFSWNHILDF